jgi:uncharacterized protein (TIGR03083 family)
MLDAPGTTIWHAGRIAYMSLPVPDRERTLREMRDTASRWAELLRSVEDPNRTAIGYWTIAEVAAHTTHIYRILEAMIGGTPSPIADHLALAEHWDKELRDDDEREPKVLADRIEEGAARIETAARAEDWEKQVTWHGGIPMPLYSLPCIVVNESEIHALDVASAESRKWDIPRSKALLAIYGVLPAVHRFVRDDVAKDMTATWQMNLRGGDTIYFVLRDGSLEMTIEAPEKIDCRVSAEPLEYLLVGYGRKSQWGPVLTGKIVAYGRKPWLSLTLGKLFRSP